MTGGSEWDKMVAGRPYRAMDGRLCAMRERARQLCDKLMSTPTGADQRRLIRQLFGAAGRAIIVRPPFFCDYGKNIVAGDRVFINFNCIILDVARVSIGNDVRIGPLVQIYAADHPLDWHERRG